MLRAAVLQMGSTPWDTAATIERLHAFARVAKTGGAELRVFPEALIGGYPKGLDFGARVGQRSPEGRAQFRRYAEGALTTFDAVGAVASDADLWLVGGVIEPKGGTLYCTVTYTRGNRAADLGLWRRKHAAGDRHTMGQTGLGDLLGELRATVAAVALCAGRTDLLRPDC